GGTAPSNTTPPAVSGTAQAGQTLTASTGVWSGSPTGYSYQWQSGPAPAGPFTTIASGQAYTVAGGDVGSYLRVLVTASNNAGSSSAPSSPVGPVTSAPGPPVTVSVSASLPADDGDVGARSPVTGGWPPSGAPAANTTGKYFTVGKRNVFGDYQAFVGLVRFDTSSLPDNAQITGATLTLYVNGKANADNRNLIGSWYDTANWPIDAADYAADVGTTALAGSPLSGLTAGQLATITLQNLGQINLTGPTGLRLGLDGAAPSGDNLVQIATADNGTNPAAKLTITYTLGGGGTAPSNTTPPAVSGTAQAGQTLTASTGVWSGSPTGYSYQWQSGPAPAGPFTTIASGQAYTVAGGDVGSYLRVLVTASNNAGSSSAPSSPVGPVTSAPGSPVTVSVSASLSADDGDVGARSPVTGGWPPSGAPAANTTGKYFTVGKRNVFGDYQAFVGLVRFDTSSLPDNAQITGATLTLYVNGKANADNRNLIGSWYDTANWPIDAADYAADVGTTALAGSPLSGLTAGQLATITLQNLGQINLTGPTGLRLGLDGAAPSGDNLVQIATADNGTNPAAKLTITYTLGGGGTAPSNTTPPAVSGTAQAGQTLTASTGVWSGSPTGYSYQWQSGPAPAGPFTTIASGQAYTVAGGDVGSYLRVLVTASNNAGSSSAPSSPVGPVTSAPGSPVTVSVSASLSADDGDVGARSPVTGGWPPSGAPAANTTG